MAASYDLRFDCGRISLDLVATAGGGPAERLVGPGHLKAWLVGSGLVPPGTALDAVDGGWLARFKALRELLRRTVLGELYGRAAEPDLARLNSAARPATPAEWAVRSDSGALVRAYPVEPECAGLLAVVARDAIGLLTDAVAREQLRQCEGEGCSRIYLDTSRGRRRRWCSSEVCGNRERVARHRRRSVTRIASATAK